MNEKIRDLFQNVELLKNVRTGIVFAIIVLIPLLYFGYRETLTINSLLSASFAGITVIVALSLYMATKETKARAFDNTQELDEELPELQKEYEENADTIQNRDKEMKQSTEWVAEYNEQQQEMYNKIKTNDRIAHLKKKAVSLRLDGKTEKAEKKEKAIERLKQDPLYDKSFQPYDIKEIVNASGSVKSNKGRKGNSELTVNPKKVNPVTQTIGTLIRSTTAGVTALIPFMLSEPIGTVLRFYATYIILVSFTVVVHYLLTTHLTLNDYKKSLTRKIKLQELLIDKLKEATHERPEVQPEASGERADTADTEQDRGSEARDIEEDRGGEE